MSRRPCIIGNWKLNKTIAEAEAFVQALLPAWPPWTASTSASAPRSSRCSPMVDSARGSQLGVLAQTMHQADSGRLHRRGLARRCSWSSTCRACCSGTPSGASSSARQTRALQEKVPRALDAGLVPVLCVGETEEERERGETEDKLRRQVKEDLAGVPAERLADVVIAYEPIWAIGTGKTATPDQAQEAVAFVRALVGGLDAGAAEEVRVLYGGSVQADNPGRAAGDARRRRRAGRRRQPRPGRLRRDRRDRAAKRMSVSGVCLIVLDGWGLAPDGPGQRGRARRHAGVRRAVGRASAHAR